MVCDFCFVGVGDFPWSYQTATEPRWIEMPGDLPTYEDDGLWAVCAACKALVEADDTQGLINRSVKAQGPEIAAREVIWKTELLTYFMEHRGPGFLPIAVRNGQHRQRA